ELTDAVLHFLAKDPLDGIPSTAQLGSEIEKIVREVGQPSLALRYAQMRQERTSEPERKPMAIAPEQYVHDCLQTYALETIFSRDVAAAAREGLVCLNGLQTPAALTSLVLETPRLAELPWWLALDDWRAAGG